MCDSVRALTIHIIERDDTGDKTVVEKTICVTDHERNVIVAGMLRVLDFNAAWTE